MVRGKGLLTARAQSEDPLHGQAEAQHLADQADQDRAPWAGVFPQMGIKEVPILCLSYVSHKTDSKANRT